jgi:hypothetical protein
MLGLRRSNAPFAETEYSSIEGQHLVWHTTSSFTSLTFYQLTFNLVEAHYPRISYHFLWLEETATGIPYTTVVDPLPYPPFNTAYH